MLHWNHNTSESCKSPTDERLPTWIPVCCVGDSVSRTLRTLWSVWAVDDNYTVKTRVVVRQSPLRRANTARAGMWAADEPA